MKTITLYQVMAGLIVGDDFDPISKHDSNWTTEKDKSIEIYNSISEKTFDKKDILKAKLRGLNTFNKYIQVCEMPIDLFNAIMFDKSTTHEQKKDFLSDLVFVKSCSFKEHLIDEVFEINIKNNYSIENLRPYKVEYLFFYNKINYGV